ncbi:MAG: D-sedoheptulose 7-phosphate isomerase [Sphingobacteriales bacterium]|nr:D-sedoheptulose 7-phosphate isomerase [Sphingobacteriales bacterium]
MNYEAIHHLVQSSIDTKQQLLQDTSLLERVLQAAQLMSQTFKNDGKVLFCGNGGSAADAQHIAAELSGRFFKDRAPLYAEALHCNSSYLTAVANDYGYNEIFARMVQAAGRSGDLLIAISTSGNSPNILKAIETARQQHMQVIGFTGAQGGKMSALCDVLLNMPSDHTPRIQECHILVGHILCELVEKDLF